MDLPFLLLRQLQDRDDPLLRSNTTAVFITIILNIIITFIFYTLYQSNHIYYMPRLSLLIAPYSLFIVLFISNTHTHQICPYKNTHEICSMKQKLSLCTYIDYIYLDHIFKFREGKIRKEPANYPHQHRQSLFQIRGEIKSIKCINTLEQLQSKTQITDQKPILYDYLFSWVKESRKIQFCSYLSHLWETESSSIYMWRYCKIYLSGYYLNYIRIRLKLLLCW